MVVIKYSYCFRKSGADCICSPIGIGGHGVTDIEIKRGENMDEVTFEYKYDDDYRPIYANGAYGGLNPRGEVVINFFTERYPIPKSEKYKYSEGRIGEKISEESEGITILRTINTGVIMSRDNAQSLYDWLGAVLKKG